MSAVAVSAIVYSVVNIAPVMASDHIVPAMVNIPAGSFIMGTDSGDSAAKPAHGVKIDAFQLAKYPVTVAEFRKFVEDTNFRIESTCKDSINKNWLSSPRAIGVARWDNNRYLESEYQPVSCINYREANAYAAWLTKKTGESYRLPSEPEFEYATKANTTSRYFWGDDPYKTQACLYGNFADQAGEYFASTQYGASCVGFLEHTNCNDGEAYISITGLYRPNPFGLYDMLGNVSQLLGQCYYDGYQARTDDEMDIAKCESIAQRGGNWHYPPQPHYTRNSYMKDEWTASSLIGFRLAKDGHSNTEHVSTKRFEQALKQAQLAHLDSRPTIPDAPTNLQLKADDTGNYQLSWQPNNSDSVLNYEVYKSTNPYPHLLGGYFKDHYELLATVDASTHLFTVKPASEGESYRVLSKSTRLTSLPSNAVSTTQSQVVTLPGRLDMQQTLSLNGASLKHRPKTEEKSELFYISAFNHKHEQPAVTSTFNVFVEKAGWYNVKYNGFIVIKEGRFFNIWQGDNLVGEIDFDNNIDDSKSNRHKVYLEAGEHKLEINVKKEGLELWSLGWIDFNEIAAR